VNLARVYTCVKWISFMLCIKKLLSEVITGRSQESRETTCMSPKSPCKMVPGKFCILYCVFAINFQVHVHSYFYTENTV
jgi:hypothetical protein